jgi:GTP-binding protein
MNKLPIVSIIGRPNVGKSTLFNRLIGKRYAITAKEAGTTRDAVSSEISWDGKSFLLNDTAGLLFDFYGFKEEEIERKAQDKLSEAISSSDIVLLILDARAGVTPDDKKAASIVRKYAGKVIVVLNKADNEDLEKKLVEANELGFKDSIAISSLNGRRTGMLLDLITKDFKKSIVSESSARKIAIVGRPNAGKSTLFNMLSGSESVIVSDIPGTTRDSVKIKIKISNKEAEIIDTAGFRKRGKIGVGIEKFSIMRAIESVYQSDIVLLVIDAKEGFTRTDAHLASLAIVNHKKLLVIINKIDLLKNQSALEVKDFDRYGFIRKNTILGISAKNKTNSDLLIRELLKLLD